MEWYSESMQDKVVVITGASEGLGKATAKKLHQAGAKVLLVANTPDKLQQCADELGERAYFYVCDVASSADIQKAVSSILQDFDHIDVLINNAGIWTDEKIEEKDPARRKKVFEVNALGTIEFIKALEPTFKKQNSGHILNVISTSGTDDTNAGNNTLWQTYGATKWALAGFTRAFKDSLQGTKIKVTGFYPGGFDSNLYENANRPNPHNQPWMMQTEDVANALVFCLTQPEDVLVEKLVMTKM